MWWGKGLFVERRFKTGSTFMTQLPLDTVAQANQYPWCRLPAVPHLPAVYFAKCDSGFLMMGMGMGAGAGLTITMGVTGFSGSGHTHTKSCTADGGMRAE